MSGTMGTVAAASPSISLNSTDDLGRMPVQLAPPLPPFATSSSSPIGPRQLSVSETTPTKSASTAATAPLPSSAFRPDASRANSHQSQHSLDAGLTAYGRSPPIGQGSPSPALSHTSQLSYPHSSSSFSPSPPQQYSPSLTGPSGSNGKSAFSPGSPGSLSRSSTVSASVSSRRKPVPEYLPMPNVHLPASHPFAGPASSKASFVSDGSTPATPYEDNLFFQPPASSSSSAQPSPATRPSGPVPPPRKNPASASNRSLASIASAQSQGRFLPREERAGSADTVVQMRDFLASAPSNASTPQGSAQAPPPPRSSSLGSSLSGAGATEDSSLPAVPPRNPSRNVTGLGISSMAANGAAGSSSDQQRQQRHRSADSATGGQDTSSNESRSAPQTPASHTPPIVATTSSGWPGDLDSHSHSHSSGLPATGKAVLASDQQGGAEPAKDEALAKADDVFSVDRPPSKRRVWEAGTCQVRDEEGNSVPFSDLFPQRGEPSSSAAGTANAPPPKTVVFFIRTFWCGQCQDYMFASMSQLDPEELKRNNVRVVIISNGSWKIIKAYRELFKCPFPIYVDASRKLYHLLGMNKKFSSFGPLKNRAAYNQDAFPVQVARGVRRGLTKMPIHNYGSVHQLGGEFIFSPGFVCEFAHRMTNRSNHMEAPDVLRAAGVAAPTKAETTDLHLAEEQQVELDRLQKEMQDWKDTRQSEIERIRQRKAARRGNFYGSGTASNQSRAALGLEDELAERDRAGGGGDGGAGEGSMHSDDTSSLVGGGSQFDLQDFLGVKLEGESMYEYERDFPGEHGEDGGEADELEMDRRFEEAMRIEEMRERGYAEAAESKERESWDSFRPQEHNLVPAHRGVMA